MPHPIRHRFVLGALALVITGAATTAIAAPRRARALGAELVETLQRELGLTRSSAEIHRGLEALDREQSSLQYTAALLDHASGESMRRLSAYAEGTDAREARLRARARALYKLARGGAARLAFGERFGDEGEGATAQRLAQARSLRELVRHDLHELSSHRRARARARAELLSASRELAALATVGGIYTMQGEVLHHAGAAIDPQVDGAVRSRKLALRRSNKTSRAANRELIRLVKSNWTELEQLRGLDGARSLRRPVVGNVVGRFGTHLDRVLAVPVVRNGVELTAAREETVYAMATGRVVMVTELPEYGEAVVIEHGGGQYSLTARLWKIAVAPGDAVEPGTALGHAAPKAIDDGLGQTVYVELRHGERPVDPEPYLRRAVATRKPKSARRGRAAVEPTPELDDAPDDEDVALLLE
ncbi:MAG: peptidoglycan DD-metalloendopeptidase family protein [Nannocystaceae bacterium]|nr:peptidoglycan DD-metalloendopeptidase family protein [Nannocystaceae bacterium]